LRELFSDGGRCGFISTRFFRPALPAVSFSSSFSRGGSPRVHFSQTFSVSPQFRSIFARSGRKTPDSDPFFFHQIPQGVNAGPFLKTPLCAGPCFGPIPDALLSGTMRFNHGWTPIHTDGAKTFSCSVSRTGKQRPPAYSSLSKCPCPGPTQTCSPSKEVGLP
jgi:hypothetical protein